MDPEEILEDEDLFEPKDSEPWLAAIKQAEKQFDRWRHLSDRIDRIYSSLDRFNSLTGDSIVLDREFDIFWASVEVIKPSIYSRAPVPVVTPRFKDRSPVKRVTADLLERSAISAFEMTDIDQVMLGVRDDLVIVGRGQLWVTYEDEGDERFASSTWTASTSCTTPLASGLKSAGSRAVLGCLAQRCANGSLIVAVICTSMPITVPSATRTTLSMARTIRSKRLASGKSGTGTRRKSSG
jgi:hypothetical protein